MIKIFIPDEVKQSVIDNIDSGNIEEKRYDFVADAFGLIHLGRNYDGRYFLLYKERLWVIYKDEVLD